MSTRKPSGAAAETEQLEADVRRIVEEGLDVQERVRALTLRYLSSGEADFSSLRATAEAVVKGAHEGVQPSLKRAASQADSVREQLTGAVTGLDGAFSQWAHASRLAMEEAAGRAQAFSKDDLSRMQKELQALQSLVIETLQSAATRTRDAGGEIFSDLASHAKRSGSATGEQVQQTLAAVTHSMMEAGKANAQAGIALTQATADAFRSIAAGMLGGMADHVQPKPRGSKKN
jgi:hypothetical protein